MVTTDPDGDNEWTVTNGENCWNTCDAHGGKCDWCGENGYCCSGYKHSQNGDCTEEMEMAIRNSIYGAADIHMCVVQPREEGCTDWVVERDWDCPGDDYEFVYVPEGITKCLDLCLADQPKCAGVTYSNSNFNRPNTCFMKTKMTNCHYLADVTSASLVHYNCLDNDDCGSAFVQMSDGNFGMIQQKKTYCGRDKPDNFYSIGNKMSIKVQVSSPQPGIKYQFKAQYKAERCSRVHTESNGVIFSPSYPGQYPPSVECQIEIQLKDSALQLAIFFSDFELEESNQCVNDYVQIDNDPKLCGSQLPLPVFRNKASAMIRFHSNDANQGQMCNQNLNT